MRQLSQYLSITCQTGMVLERCNYCVYYRWQYALGVGKEPPASVPAKLEILPFLPLKVTAVLKSSVQARLAEFQSSLVFSVPPRTTVCSLV